MKKVKKISKVCMLLVCIISLVCIPFATSASAASYEPAKAAKINYFGATQTSINPGGSVYLKWNVSNADKIDIKGIEKDKEELNPQQGEIEVWPEVTTTYILTAYGKGGDASTTVTVNVGTQSKAKVNYFNASATSVQKGNSVKLSWGTSNAKTVEIKGFEKVEEGLDPSGDLDVWPEVTTTYVLWAYGANGDADSKSITVNVTDQPQIPDAYINYFNASNSDIYTGQSTNLNWQATNAKSVEIKNVKTGLAAQGSFNVAPKYTTTYTLEVVGYNGKTASKTVTVTVKQPQNNPTINYFNATDMTISKGDMVTLSWGTTNTTGCMILTSDGNKLTNKASTGKITVTPNSTRTYTLVAYNANKEQVQKSITITVK